MNTIVEKIEKNLVKVTVTLGAEKFKEALTKAHKQNGHKLSVQGFRKGKAPLSMLKKMYGEDVFYNEAEELLINESMSKAIIENNIKLVDRPTIDVVQTGESKEFIYTASIVTLPEVELGEYKGVEVKTVESAVTDADLTTELNEMLDKNSRLTSKEDGTIENTDIAVIDFEGFVDGVPFEGGKGENYSLTIGSHSFIDTFEDQLIGMKVSDSKDVVVNFPENYGRENLNGKEATFKVTINEIKFKEVPALDDEFAKEVSEFDTLEELKADMKKKMEEYKIEQSKAEQEDKVIEVVVNNATIEIPQVMIDQETDTMIKDLEGKLKGQGLDLNTYYKFTNSSEEKVREFMKENAEKRVKADLVLSAIAKVENIVATEEEVLEKAKEVAVKWGTEDLEKNAQLLIANQKEYIVNDIMNAKVIDLIVSGAKLV